MSKKKKRKWVKPETMPYLRPRCYYCESLELVQIRGRQPNGDVYYRCKICSKETKAVERVEWLKKTPGRT